MKTPESLISKSFSMDGMEPRVVLFPLSGGNIETVRTPQTPVSNVQPLRSMVSPPPERDEAPCTNEEILRLKRRLEAIKLKRAQHRMLHQRKIHQKKLPSVIDTELNTTQETVTTGASYSIIDESQSWNPRRLLCSTHKTQARVTGHFSQKGAEKNNSIDRPALDLIVCSKPKSRTDHQQYTNLAEDEESAWDPYVERMPPCTNEHQPYTQLALQERAGSLEDDVPRTKAYSVIHSDSSDSAQLMLSSRSCISARRRKETTKAWYVRPSGMEAIPDANAQVMNMVWFSTKE